MTKKGLNGLSDIKTAAYAELSYFDIDKPSVSLYDSYVTLENGFVVYKEPIDILTELVQQRSLGEHDSEYKLELNGGKVIATANNTNGFSAIAIEEASGEIVISYRGTDMTSIKDWFDNGSTMLYAGSSQSKDAQAFFDLVKGLADKDDRIALVGHSKGGELALKVALQNIDDISSVNTLSAQPPNTKQMGISEKELKNIIDENRDKFNLVRMEGDFVPFLGNFSNPFKDITRVIKTNKYNKSLKWNIHVLSHSLSSIKLNGTDFEESDGENINTILFHVSIEELLTLVQYIAPPLIEIVKMGIHEIVQDINEIIEISNLVVELIIEVAGNLAKEAVNQIILGFNKVVNAFEALFGNHKKNKIVITTTEIKVDTEHLKDLAQRLVIVRNRLNQLDSDLNYLYLTEPLTVIKNLLKANRLLPSKRKVNGCINFLEGTAIAFEKAEKNIKALG